MEVLNGIAASSGIGIGPAFIVPAIQARTIPQYVVDSSDTDNEWLRLQTALSFVSKKIKTKLKDASSKQAEILQTYIVMLEDAEFLKNVQSTLNSTSMNIEYVLNMKVSETIDVLRAVNDEYLAERAADVSDVFGQVIDQMLGYEPFDYDSIPENVVVVAESISPADAVVLMHRNIRGLVVTEGGASSHLAILARNARLPAVFGISYLSQKIVSGVDVVVNGSDGTVTIQPDKATLAKFRALAQAEKKDISKLEKIKTQPAFSADGVKFQLFANIGLPEEAQAALEEGADGIGLFRTEFLFMGSIQSAKKAGSSGVHSVTEEAQFNAYSKVLQIMGDRPVTIRTLDTGGDKLIKDAGIPVATEQNPLLGSRAIRLTLAHTNLFKRQLRALFRAGVNGNLRIMLPLVTHVSQIQQTLKIIEEVKEDLSQNDIPFKQDIPLGIMVETAATAVAADVFAKHSAFFSVGTNDLTQYTLGIDRENVAVASLYEERNIAVLRLIKNTVLCGAKAGIPVAVCGEMAGDVQNACLLAGLGVRNFSMAPVRIGAVKAALSSKTISEFEKMAEEVLGATEI
ncbi:MAG: phosphoenolpyruvate--protein phosphotransferase [Spirochaetaceae bacterium]|nr:phosphoenolpyruvate--protein phosphotransferase [Spirochaetaceae bacterium]